jgi:ABC-type sugar transport system permease subunit
MCNLRPGPPRNTTGPATRLNRTTQWVYGWLLLLPAMALLALFTHYPALANLWHSFHSTAKGDLPAASTTMRSWSRIPCSGNR